MISLSLGNSRMKDFFDVYQILTRQDVDPGILGEAIRATFANRDTKYVESHPLFSKELYADATRTMYWRGFLRKIKYAGSLPFDEVGIIIRDRLRPYWETLK